MSRETFVTGIDIGSYSVTTLVGSFSDNIPLPQIVGVGKTRSTGIRRGVIIDLESATETIQRSIKEAERVSGTTIRRAYVNIGGDHIVSLVSRGVVAVSRADGQISEDDVERVVTTAASTVVMPNNREILHNIPREYIVDGEGGLRDVVGMNGVRLEANTLIVGGSSAHLKNVEQAIRECGLEVEGTIITPIAASSAILSRRQKELGVLCIDIGGGTTSLAVFEEGNLIYTNVLPIGGDNITNDLAIGLRVHTDVAERIKREYGMAIASEVSKRDIIDFSQFDPNEKGSVSRKDVVEIMEARLHEIFDVVNKELRRIGKEALLPGGVVLVGGSAKIPHIVNLCKGVLRLPVQIGFPRDVEGISASVDDPSYAVALGLVFQGFEEKHHGIKISLPKFGWAGNAGSAVKRWLKALLP